LSHRLRRNGLTHAQTHTCFASFKCIRLCLTHTNTPTHPRHHIASQVNYTLFDARFVPSSARLVALGNHARGTGALDVCAIEDGRVVVKSSHEKPHGFKCGTFGASSAEERFLATGDFKGVRALAVAVAVVVAVAACRTDQALASCSPAAANRVEFIRGQPSQPGAASRNVHVEVAARQVRCLISQKLCPREAI
jgi:hypothetical protein